MKKLLRYLFLLSALFLVFGSCATTTVTFSDGTPKHESINTALQSNGLDIRLVSIIPGGTTNSYRGMTLTSYALSETEVTQGDYETVSGPTGTNYVFGGYGAGDTNPVMFVSWDEAIKFCNDLSALCGLEKVYNESTGEADFTKNGFYIPTEAQWEYAAGGPEHYEWSLGNTFKKSDYVIDDTQSRPVKSHPANGFGLYDMSGNLLEWSHDWYGKTFPHIAATDPSGPSNSSQRVYKGGGWKTSDSFYLRIEYRMRRDPSAGHQELGFRVAAGGFGNW